MDISTEFKQKVVAAMLERRNNYGGSDSDFAKTLGINKSVYNRIKNGEINQILSDGKWLQLAREFEINIYNIKWATARTSVYAEIEDNLHFCKEFSKSMILVDACGIGKTYCAKHIAKTMKNTFYIDCSQAKTKIQFIKLLAKTIGVENVGKFLEIKANIKYYLTLLDKPLIILDEAGDLEYTTFLELKELWNATQAACGWYMMGADGLRAKITKGIRNEKVGFAEIFSRFSDNYVQLTPYGIDDKKVFYTQLLGDVASANVKDTSKVPTLIKKCLDHKKTLRHLETLIQMG